MTLAQGTRLGPYEIVEAVGSGGMGEVYRARDTRLNRDIALKLLPLAYADHPERLGRFEREAQAVAALNHPNIVTIHSVEQAGGQRFLTMEFIEGQTLAAVIKSKRPSLDDLLAIAVPLCDAVSAAHARGIVHRDIKPGNVMITAEGRVKVLDFGLAKLREDETAAEPITGPVGEQITRPLQVIGTVEYMSPEQAEGRPVDHRTDIFSLGVVLYEMATGRRPFEGDTPVSVMSSTRRDTPPAVTALNPEVPAELSRIIRRALAKDPQRRYQTAIDLRNDLEELKTDVEMGTLVSAVPAAGVGRRNRRGQWLMGVAIVGVALAAVGLWRYGPARGKGRGSVDATFSQLTTLSGWEADPSLSPDGRWVVYQGRQAGNWDVYLQSVPGEAPINLTADSSDDDTQPAFSPDGEQIAFRSERGGGGLFVMGRTGGSVRRVIDGGYNPSWSADATMLVYATEEVSYTPYSRSTVSHLWTVNVATGERRQLSDVDAVQPAWSPNGQRIAFWAAPPPGSQRDIWTIAAAGGEPVRVTDDTAADWSPVWSPDGKYLYFASDRGGTQNLWRVRIDEASGHVTGPAEAITSPSPYAGNPSLSATGDRLVYESWVGARNVVRAMFDPARGVVVDRAVPVTAVFGRYWTLPDVSPDGQWLAFQSTLSEMDIFVSRSDGTGLRQLTKDPAMDRMPTWSPDGTRVAFYSNRGGGYNVWVVNADGSSLKQLTASPTHGIEFPVWSPDGARMVVGQLRPTSKAMIIDTETAWDAQTPVELPRPDWLDPKRGRFVVSGWSPNGRWLAGNSTSPGGVFRYDLETRTYERLSNFGQRPAWLADSRRLVFHADGKIYLLDAVTKASQELVVLDGESLSSARLPRDNRSLFFASSRSEGDIWMATLK